MVTMSFAKRSFFIFIIYGPLIGVAFGAIVSMTNMFIFFFSYLVGVFFAAKAWLLYVVSLKILSRIAASRPRLKAYISSSYIVVIGAIIGAISGWLAVTLFFCQSHNWNYSAYSSCMKTVLVSFGFSTWLPGFLCGSVSSVSLIKSDQKKLMI